VWLLILPLPASLLTAAIQPLAPRVHEKCQVLNLASQHPGMKTQVRFRCNTQGTQASWMDVWFDDSDALNADDRLTTVLTVNSAGTYWYRLNAKGFVFHPCGLDTQSFVDCLQSIGDHRPETDVRRDAEALATTTAKISSTGLFPESINGFRQISTNSWEWLGFVPNWFEWTIGVFWFTVVAIGVILIYRSEVRASARANAVKGRVP